MPILTKRAGTLQFPRSSGQELTTMPFKPGITARIAISSLSTQFSVLAPRRRSADGVVLGARCLVLRRRSNFASKLTKSVWITATPQLGLPNTNQERVRLKSDRFDVSLFCSQNSRPASSEGVQKSDLPRLLHLANDRINPLGGETGTKPEPTVTGQSQIVSKCGRTCLIGRTLNL